MTLQESILSGRKFKRKDWNIWYHPDGRNHNVSSKDILADDWIVEEPEKPKEKISFMCDVEWEYDAQLDVHYIPTTTLLAYGIKGLAGKKGKLIFVEEG